MSETHEFEPRGIRDADICRICGRHQTTCVRLNALEDAAQACERVGQYSSSRERAQVAFECVNVIRRLAAENGR